MRAPTLVVVAARDSSGGAGVDADCEAATAIGARALVVLTAETVQDAGGVQAVEPYDPAAWSQRAREALLGARALKLGLLPGAEHVRAAAELARMATELALPFVVDPVLVASSGHRFLDTAALVALRDELLPRGGIWTPNLPEAAELAGLPLALEPQAREELARALLAAGARAVVLKGGHGAEDPVRDLLLERDGAPVWIEHPRWPGPGIRGSGCRFASALAAGLACGAPLADAARAAAGYVADRIRHAGA